MKNIYGDWEAVITEVFMQHLLSSKINSKSILFITSPLFCNFLDIIHYA